MFSSRREFLFLSDRQKRRRLAASHINNSSIDSNLDQNTIDFENQTPSDFCTFIPPQLDICTSSRNLTNITDSNFEFSHSSDSQFLV